MNKTLINYLVTLFVFLISLNTLAATNFFLVITVDDRQVKRLLASEVAASRTYRAPRHVTLMWLNGVNLRDVRMHSLTSHLKNIATDFLKNTKTSVIEFSGVSAFPRGGGVYLELTPASKRTLENLYQQLTNEISRQGFSRNIDPRLRNYTPHLTILEAAQMQALFPGREREAFIRRLNSKFKEIAQPTRSGKIVRIPIKTVTHW